MGRSGLRVSRFSLGGWLTYGGLCPALELLATHPMYPALMYLLPRAGYQELSRETQ